jgi:hypothetical protein
MPGQENIRLHKVWNVPGTLNIQSGGALNIQTGASVTKDGVDMTEQIGFVKYKRVTIAQVNAGNELLPALVGKAYRITGLMIRAIGGAAAAVTSVDIQDGAGTPVVVAVYSQAQLTEGTILTENTTGAAMGAGFLVGTTVSKAVNIIKNGSDVTTATHFDVVVQYQVVADQS